jgi:transposase InsO family protein
MLHVAVGSVTELCLTALQMALEARPALACIHHSDRGVQYASARYVALLRQHGLQISMSAKGILTTMPSWSRSTKL